MPTRLDVTTVTGEGVGWSPADDFIIQVKADHRGALFDVLGRVDEAADWMLVATIKPENKFERFARLPFVKIAVRENKAGSAAKAWSDF